MAGTFYPAGPVYESPALTLTAKRSGRRPIPSDQAAYGALPAQAPRVLDAILFKGALPRGEVAGIINQSERTARNVTTALSNEGIIYSAGPRDDWQIAFPAKLTPRLMPGLFP